MKYKIIFSKNAKDDLLSIVRYIRDELISPSSAEKQSNRILSAIKALDEMPMRFRLYDHSKWKTLGLRFLLVDNYLIFYIPDENTKLVKIYRIIYGKRDVENHLKEIVTFENE